MRSKKVFINSMTSIAMQIVVILFTFITRIYFIKILGETLLGVNSLFTQMLSMISLVELGIGPAIIYSLYEPLAKNDTEKIAAIMGLYKKIYTFIGILIFIIGLALSPFVYSFAGGSESISNLQFLFILFVINSSSSYFYSYKQNLLIADQSKYIYNIVHCILYIILNIVQLIILFTTKSYTLYLIIRVLVTVIENVIISHISNIRYPFLRSKTVPSVDKITLESLKKNVKALIFHKIGGVMIESTDNLIISMFINVTTVGIYSNYSLVLNSLDTLCVHFFASFTPSIGNYNIDSNKKDLYDLFVHINFIVYVVFSIICICSLTLFSDFITLFFRADLNFPLIIVFTIVIKFYLSGLRKALLIFKEALGIYWQDRYRPIVEALLNIVLSIILIKLYGIIGIFLGTIISNLLANYLVEPYILYKYGFDKKPYDYYKILVREIGWFSICCFVVFFLMKYYVVFTKPGFILKAILTLLLTVIITIFPYLKSPSFKFIKDKMMSILHLV